MNWWPQWFLAVLMIFVCFLLVVVVLLQRGRGGGLAGAFGGAGGSSAFGAKTGDVLTWVTVAVAGIFLLLNVALNFAFDKSPLPAPKPTITTTEVPAGPEGGDATKSDAGNAQPAVVPAETDSSKEPVKQPVGTVTPTAPGSDVPKTPPPTEGSNGTTSDGPGSDDGAKPQTQDPPQP